MGIRLNAQPLQDGCPHAIGSLEGNGPERAGRPVPGLGIRVSQFSAKSGNIALLAKHRDAPTDVVDCVEEPRSFGVPVSRHKAAGVRKEGPGDIRRSPMDDLMERAECVREPA
jgi:hypothetical protein